jgi:hypothetical protein
VTPGPVPTGVGVIDATPAPLDTGTAILIRYELQPEERLVRIAEIFGTSRQAIERVNEEQGTELEPRDARAGDIIIVPVSPAMSEAEIRALPGFVEFVEPVEPIGTVEPGG